MVASTDERSCPAQQAEQTKPGSAADPKSLPKNEDLEQTTDLLQDSPPGSCEISASPRHVEGEMQASPESTYSSAGHEEKEEIEGGTTSPAAKKRKMQAATAEEECSTTTKSPKELMGTYFQTKLKGPDNFYHLGLDQADSRLKGLFGNVRMILMMGSADRAKKLAEKIDVNFPIPEDQLDSTVHGITTSKKDAETKERSVEDLSRAKDRGSLFVTGYCPTEQKKNCVLIFSHGMGNASTSIFLNEITKLLFWSGCEMKKLEALRIGTCGGLNVPEGTVCITERAMDGQEEWGYEFTAFGQKFRDPADADNKMVAELTKIGKDMPFPCTVGNTMTTDDYYLGQGRLDGALLPPGHFNLSSGGPGDGAAAMNTSEMNLIDEKQQKEWFVKLHEKHGIVNMEMEATGILAFFQRLKIPAAVIAVALLNRYNGDQHKVSREQIKAYSERHLALAMQYLHQRTFAVLK
ncbi:unnamed protein product [Amoebophrya sp. A120]|nr:unnamed protein product [Amoebophrya sp. A120]|eukprot:GSA120T00023832001.1